MPAPEGIKGNECVIALGMSVLALILEIITLAVPYYHGFALTWICAGNYCGNAAYWAGGIDFTLTFIALLATLITIVYYILFMIAQPTLAQIPVPLQVAMMFATGFATILITIGWILFLIAHAIQFGTGWSISAGIFMAMITSIVLAIATIFTFSRHKKGEATVATAQNDNAANPDANADPSAQAQAQAHPVPQGQPIDPSAPQNQAHVNAVHNQA